MIAIEGRTPVAINGRIGGGMTVSGDTLEQDVEVAAAALLEVNQHQALRIA